MRFLGIPVDLWSQFCCSTSQLCFPSQHGDSAVPRHGSLCHRGYPETRLDKPSLTDRGTRPISYHKQQQHHYPPITDQKIKSRRVLKGIIWAIPGLFHYREIWRRAAPAVQCGCPLWPTAVLHSVVGERRDRAQNRYASLSVDASQPQQLLTSV